MRFTNFTKAAVSVVLVAGALSLGGGAAQAASSSCSEVSVPVSLAAGLPAQYRIAGRLCVPAGTPPTTIELLVPGVTYTSLYWAFPDPKGGTERYNFTAAANAAGFATLAIDRIGTGQSSHPFGPLVTIESNAYTVHEVIQAIRDGRITAPGGERFMKIVYIGHSYGSWAGWYEVSQYNDVNAFVITGATHHPNPQGLAIGLTSLYPAFLDPGLAPLREDPSYLTTLPGARRAFFYGTAPVDPAVVAYDEAHKSTLTASEIDDFPLFYAHRLNIRVPVFLVDGKHDEIFCGGSLGGADCSSATSLVAGERPFLGPHVPLVDGYVLADSGHDLNMAQDAPEYFSAVQRWVAVHVGGS